MRKSLFIIVLLVVVCVSLIGIGFFLVGSPLTLRETRFDMQRTDDISTIEANISSFFTDKNRLPKDLKEMSILNSNLDTPLLDPETKMPYVYLPNSDMSYSLCVVYSLDTRKVISGKNDPTSDSKHPKGRFCTKVDSLAANAPIPTTQSLMQSSTWTETTSLPVILYEATTKTYTAPAGDTFAYEIGGYDPMHNAVVDSVYYSKVNGDGTMGNWKKTVPLPQGLRAPESVLNASSSALYVLGGEYDDINHKNSDSVYMTTVHADGTIAAWSKISTLPQPLDELNVVAYNGYIYVIGGWNNGQPSAAVYMAKMNADATLGAWQAVSTLPAALAASGTAVVRTSSGGYIYVVGGDTNIYSLSQNVNSVYVAKVLDDGSLSAWKETESYPVSVSEQVLNVYEKDSKTYLISMGGFSNSTWSNIIYTAVVHADGSLDPWVVSGDTLTQGLTSTTSFLSTNPQGNTSIYILGGGANVSTNGGIDTVYVTDIDALLGQ